MTLLNIINATNWANQNPFQAVSIEGAIRLLNYRPQDLLNEAVINKVLIALEDLEAKLQEPFNRFSDTLAADEVELNFKYVIQFPCIGVSLTRVIRR